MASPLSKSTAMSRSQVPPITTGFIMLLCIVFFVLQCHYGVKHKPYNLRPKRVLINREYYRLFTSALMHRNYRHLGLNLLACWSEGSSLEQDYGWMYLLGSTLFSMTLTSSLYVLLAHVHDSIAATPFKAVKGFSGILFHWTTLDCLRDCRATRSIWGMVKVPAVWYPWLLMVLLALADARSSWLIHTCGILTGMLQYHVERIVLSSSSGDNRVQENTGENQAATTDIQKVDPTRLRKARLQKFD